MKFLTLSLFNRFLQRNGVRAIFLAGLLIAGYESVRYVVVSLYQGVRDRLESARRADPAITVGVEEVRRGSIVRHITVPGRLAANQKVVLRAEVEGKLRAVHFEGGQAVKKGDPLYELEDNILKAQLKESQAKLVLARQELERAARLAEHSAGTLKQKEKAQADLLEAEASVEINQHRVDNAMIRAPFEGYIGLNNVTPGSFITPQIELATIVDADPMKVDFRVPARYLKQISVGQSVSLIIEGMDTQAIDAKIVNVDAKIEDGVHSAAVRASVRNPRNFLKSGLFAQVKLVVGSKDNVLLISRDAVKRSADEEYVLCADMLSLPGEKPYLGAYKLPVTVGLESGESLEIVRGLQEGMKIINAGLDKVQIGSPIRIIDDAMSEGEASPTLEDLDPLNAHARRS